MQASQAGYRQVGGRALLLLAGIVAFYHFADQSLLLRVLGLLAVAACCGGRIADSVGRVDCGILAAMPDGSAQGGLADAPGDHPDNAGVFVMVVI